MKRVRCLFWLLAVAGCSPSTSEGPDPLILWHAYRGAEAEALDASIKRFQAENPSIKIRSVSIPYDAFANKLRVSVPRGNGPDVFIFAHDQVGDWARGRLIEPLGFWATEPVLNRFFKPTLDALIFEDVLYGLPLAFKTLALFYDRTLVNEPAQTTDALVSQAREIRRKNPEHWGLGYELDSLYFHAPWLHAFGGGVFDKNGAIRLKSDPMSSSMSFVKKLLVDAKIVPEEATSALVTSLFIQHKLAYVISGPWFLGELKSHAQWGVTSLPVVSEVGRPARPYLGVEGVLMSARSQNKTDAFRLMRFLTRDTEARSRWTNSQQLVANRLVFDDSNVLKSPFAQAFKEQLKQTVPLSNRPEMKRVWAPMKRALGQGITRGRPIGQALDEAEIAVRRFEK